MIIGAVLVFGIVSFFGLPIDLMPKIDFPYVTVQAVYPGAGPEEIETSVAKPMEEQLSTVSGLKNVTSYCMEGVAYIVLEFNLGVNADIASIDVKDKLDAIAANLPKDMDKPVISKFDINAQPIINLAVTGPQDPKDLRHIAEKQVKDQIAKIMGVSQITVTGGHEREIQIHLHKKELDGIGQSVNGVAGIIASQTANIPGGHISSEHTEYTVRVLGEFKNMDEISQIRIPVLKTTAGQNTPTVGGEAYVPLSSIADVVDTYKEIREKARYNHENSVGLAIQKNTDANTVALSNKILKEVDRLNTVLPPGVKINIAQDRSLYIKSSVSEMYMNIIIGILLTGAMLFFFLGDWRLMIVATTVIPASVLVTFLGMKLFGFTINIITLMAIGIAIGQLVTDAIIVLESIVRHRDQGMPIKEAAVVGTKEVIIAVIASAFTHSAVFLPMANMQGITGQFFKSLGITLVIAVLSSLVFALTLTPMLASLLLKDKKAAQPGVQQKKNVAEKYLAPITARYIRLLTWSLKHKPVIVLGTILLFFGTMFSMFGSLGKEFMPKSDEGLIQVSLEMPTGASLTQTDNTLDTIETRLQKIPELKSIYTSLGGTGTSTGVNVGSLLIQLKDKKERVRTTDDVANDIRNKITDLPDAKLVVKPTQSGGGHSSTDIQVEITGDKMSEILRLADSVKAKALTVPGLADVDISWKEAKPEIKFIPDRYRMDEYGVNISTLGANLRSAMSGNEAAVYREDNDEYNIRVQLDEFDRQSVSQVEELSVPTQKGIVPMKSLAKVVQEGGAASVDRKNRQRLVMVTANVAQGSVGTKAGELQKLTAQITLQPGYKIFYGGSTEMMQDTFHDLVIALILAILLVYMVLAGSLESLVQPFLIMLTLPLGLIGVVWALFITGKALSMISVMSIIMLIGIVVNNAILLMDYAFQKIRQGRTVRQAIVEACRVKFIAIIMMNLAIVLSSLPQALSAGTFNQPFAITAIGGVLVSTMMTFFVIPVVFDWSVKKQKIKAIEE
jgi:hydrophobic/amphiphilic exporter-1 (mainly G- bacteria), HAE1 family